MRKLAVVLVLAVVAAGGCGERERPDPGDPCTEGDRPVCSADERHVLTCNTTTLVWEAAACPEFQKCMDGSREVYCIDR